MTDERKRNRLRQRRLEYKLRRKLKKEKMKNMDLQMIELDSLIRNIIHKKIEGKSES